MLYRDPQSFIALALETGITKLRNTSPVCVISTPDSSFQLQCEAEVDDTSNRIIDWPPHSPTR